MQLPPSLGTNPAHNMKLLEKLACPRRCAWGLVDVSDLLPCAPAQLLPALDLAAAERAAAAAAVGAPSLTTTCTAHGCWLSLMGGSWVLDK